MECEGGLEENPENIYISEMNRRGCNKKKEFLAVGSKEGEISFSHRNRDLSSEWPTMSNVSRKASKIKTEVSTGNCTRSLVKVALEEC